MNVNDLSNTAHYRLSKIMEALDTLHGVQLDFTKADFDTLIGVLEDCQSTRQSIVESTSFNTYHENKKFQEVGLIQEAIHIFLSEVAPKRLNRRLKTTTAFGADNE